MTTTNVIRTARTYGRDLAERVVWTFILAAGSVMMAAGPLDMFNASLWETVGAAGVAAVGSLLKGLLARTIGDKNSASTASSV